MKPEVQMKAEVHISTFGCGRATEVYFASTLLAFGSDARKRCCAPYRMHA